MLGRIIEWIINLVNVFSFGSISKTGHQVNTLKLFYRPAMPESVSVLDDPPTFSLPPHKLLWHHKMLSKFILLTSRTDSRKARNLITFVMKLQIIKMPHQIFLWTKGLSGTTYKLLFSIHFT